MSVSIIMPVKNAAPFLDACLKSILAQSYDDFELIAIDDHSLDESAPILRSYKNDPRMRVLKNEESGIISALALGFCHSKGDFIHRMDADDLMPKDKLENLVQMMDEGPQKKVATGKVRYFSHDEVSEGYLRYQVWLNGMHDHNSYEKMVYRECVVASPNWLVHRSCFEEDIELSSLSYPEDYDLVLKWYSLGYTFVSTPAITHLWREHPKRLSRRSKLYDQESFFSLKTNYFVENEIMPGETVQLIGAGEKGKLVASILGASRKSFNWFDVRARYIGSQKLYAEDILKIKEGRKTILTVWPDKESVRQEITAFLACKGLEFGKNLWLF